jgi:hypothetical protein
MMVVLLGHSKVSRFEAPDTEAYDRYDLALDKQTSPLVMQWADSVLFVNYVTHAKKVGDRFNASKHRGIGEGERRVFTSERPAYHAKNRYGMEHETDFDWKAMYPFFFPKKKVEEAEPVEANKTNETIEEKK